MFGKEHTEWIIDQQDKNNHIDYTLNYDNLERQVIVNGEAASKGKKVPTEAGDSYRIEIDITREQIVIKDRLGKELDRYPRPDPSQALGTFGFKGDVELAVRSVK
jgi:hypothetical protein